MSACFSCGTDTTHLGGGFCDPCWGEEEKREISDESRT